MSFTRLVAAGFDLALTGFDPAELPFQFPGEQPASVDGAASEQQSRTLAERFGIPPFSVFNAREGWWQDRKRAWIELGIRSELGRGAPIGGAPMPIDRAKANETASFRDQDRLAAIQGQKRGSAPQRQADHRCRQPTTRNRKRAATAAAGRCRTGERRMTNLTFVKGSRDPENLDPVSAAILEVASTGTSIFDPVVCEIAYRWFCPPGGAVLDPFAGGSVRGIVASKLGRPYTGIDLRAEQIDANRAQAEQICGEPMPRWVCGDSREVMPALAQQGIAPQFDFIFTCPPYADLEVYSDDPRDLSTLDYDEFRAAYANIIAGACALLKPDRFACFVVGDVRDRQGFYRNFPGHTIEAFEAAGLRLYNEAILVTAVGSLPIRAGKQFAATRKLGKTHQNCLVFIKGDPRKATEAIGEVEFGELASGQELPLAGVEAL